MMIGKPMMNGKIRILAKRVPIRFFPIGYRKNSLMAHYVDDADRPICGAVINPARWAEVPADEVADYEICKNCLREADR